VIFFTRKKERKNKSLLGLGEGNMEGTEREIFKIRRGDGAMARQFLLLDGQKGKALGKYSRLVIIHG